MRILNKDSYWWKGQEKEWAMQDNSGNWWIYKENKKSPLMKTNDKRRNGQTSNRFTAEHYVIFILACVLGVSMVLNIITLITLMS